MLRLPKPAQDEQEADENSLVSVNKIQSKEHYTRYTDLLRLYGSFLLETINSINLYSPNYATSSCTKKTLAEIRREVENIHIMVAGYNVCLSVMEKTNGQEEQNFRMSEQNYQQIGVTLICEFCRSLKLFLENNY